MSKKSKWAELGIITKNPVLDKNKNEVKDQNGNVVTKLGFKLSDEIYEVLCKAGYNISQYGVLKTPVEEVDGLIRAGAITEDKIEERKEKAKEVYSWLRYKVQLPPPKDKSAQ